MCMPYVLGFVYIEEIRDLLVMNILEGFDYYLGLLYLRYLNIIKNIN